MWLIKTFNQTFWLEKIMEHDIISVGMVKSARPVSVTKLSFILFLIIILTLKFLGEDTLIKFD
jgi:hypothetical protein